jgi:hypothetical protein
MMQQAGAGRARLPPSRGFPRRARLRGDPPLNQPFRVNHDTRNHLLKAEMADAPDLVRAA